MNHQINEEQEEFLHKLLDAQGPEPIKSLVKMQTLIKERDIKNKKFDLIVSNLAEQMQYKLDKNHHKYCPEMNPDGKGRNYSECSTEWLIMRLRQEVDELEESIERKDFANAKRECGDVGNFSAFINDRL